MRHGYKFLIVLIPCLVTAVLYSFDYFSKTGTVQETINPSLVVKESTEPTKKNWKKAKRDFIFSPLDYYVSSPEISIQAFEVSHFIPDTESLSKKFTIIKAKEEFSSLKEQDKSSQKAPFTVVGKLIPTTFNVIYTHVAQNTDDHKDNNQEAPSPSITNSIRIKGISVPIPLSRPTIHYTYNNTYIPPKNVPMYDENQQKASNPNIQMLISKYAKLYQVPEKLVHRVVKRESGYNPNAYSKGNFGLMQIRYNTARSLGYSGPPHGLLDVETNLKYAVKYLRGAWLVAGNEDQTINLYARGYYNDAKRKGMLHVLNQ